MKNIPPERIRDFVNELNKQLKDNGAGVRMTATSDGRTFLYEELGETAIQIIAMEPRKSNRFGTKPMVQLLLSLERRSIETLTVL